VSRDVLFKAMALGRSKSPNLKPAYRFKQLEIKLLLWKAELLQGGDTQRAGLERPLALLSTNTGIC